MKKCLAIFFLLVATRALSQDTAKTVETTLTHNSYERNTYIVTGSVGFINSYRSEYEVPAGFEKGIVSGFLPMSARVEYAIDNRISLSLGMAFSSIIYNSSQLYTGYSSPIRRNRANKFSMYSGVLTGYYHFGHMLHIARLDPFVGAGVYLNNLKYSALPQGDSTVEKIQHTATPYLKVGARYYISDKVSVYTEAGFDKLSIINLGISCRFFPKKNNVVPAAKQ